MSRLYVGSLPLDARRRDIERLFETYGELRDVVLRRGFGFVEFRDRRDADDALYNLNGKNFLGEKNAGPPQRTRFRILVENISSSVSWQDLKDFMREAGDVCFADAHKLRRGEGIVEFETEEGMENALRKLDGVEFKGRRISLRQDRNSRGGPRGRSRSRSRSRSPARRGRGYSPDKKAGGRSRSRSPSKKEDKFRTTDSWDHDEKPADDGMKVENDENNDSWAAAGDQ
ncbi:hypothetical protein BB560_006100 [Smittium megazygosporum]|uniref:RRM domain-containing protein n=1 Tax=Smittium megazygosporum TaxID=133381 RepID=A0A2T9YHQ5_9FUNG|nr:hypothetical protein BB560_006100 [Smittium megazygosporum]